MSEASLLGCVPFSGRRSGRALAAGILLATAGCSPRGDGGAATDKDIVRRSALGVSIDAQWLPAGPGSMSDNFVLTLAGFNGDGTPIFSSTSTGAVNSIVAHPSDVNTLYVGAVNGGVWRTHNATAPQPDWAPLTDFLPSLATGVLGMDPTNPLVLAAGTGNYSNFLGVTKLDGAGYVYITSDGGDHWTTIADPSVRGENLSSIHILGARILVSATDGPIFRRATAGDVFVQSDSGIPSYNTVYSMVGDRTTPGVSRFYAAVRGQGIYLSENDGVSWVRASNGPLQQALANPDLTWAKLAVGTTGRVAVTGATGPDVACVGFSDNRGGTWTALDVPRFPVVSQGQPVPPAAIQSFSADASNRLIINTAAPHNLPIGFHVRIAGVTGNPVSGRDVNADWTAVGVPDPNGQKFALRDPITGEDALSSGNAASGGTFQPWVSVNSGGQAGNVGIAIDPANSKFIYLGGDKQADIIGGFTAIVRANVTIAADNGIPSSQWTSIVATGTGNGTSPHPDTRAFAFDAQGSLLVVNDGGAYRRIDPQSQTGDWQSLNSTLETAEQHDIAVDPETGLAASGNQDNGVTAQRPGPTPRQWQTVIRGDGGDVHFVRRPTQSERWASVQSLICLSKTPVAAGIDLSGFQPPALCISGPCNSRCTTPAAELQGSTIYEAEPLPFLTRFAMNQAALDANPTGPERLVIAAGQAIYESRDSGQNVSSIGGPPNTIDLVYGTPANPDALWAVARSNPPVWRRLTPNGPLTAATTPPELAPQTFLNGGVAMDPAQPASAYVVAGTQVFSTNDGGASWNDVTGDLTPSSCGVTKASRPNLIYSIVLVPSPTFGNRIFIGADGGVFMSAASEPTIWTLVSGTMAHAPVIDLEYDNGNGRDTLNAGTLGRGTWKMQNASRINRPPVATCRDQFLIADATCHASIPANQFDGGSIDPEGDAALIFTADPGAPYALGNKCITVTVNDGHGALATCDANLIVVDATPPVLAQPAAATFVLCDPNGESITLPVPTATDNCTTPTVTGAVIASTDPTITLPKPLNGGTVVLGSGTHTIRWTATDGVNSSSVDQTVTTRPAIYATQSIDLRDRAATRLPDSTLATIMNSGTGSTHVGVTGKTGDIWSRGAVTIDDRATVSGFIRSAAGVQLGNQVSVVGPVVRNTPITFPPTLDTTTTFPASRGDVPVGIGGQRTLTPGSYGRVSVQRNGVLALANGQYWIQDLDLEPQSRMTVSQSTSKVLVNVRNSVIMRGDVSVTPSAVVFLMAYLGTTAAALERPFTGVFAAPNATLTLGATTFQTFTGQFYARSIVLQPDDTVVCRKDF